MGKQDAKSLKFILNTNRTSENIRLYGSVIYRYFFRLVNALSFRLWKTNFSHIYFMCGIFFICLIINIYWLGYLLENKWLGFISSVLFFSFKDIYSSLVAWDYPTLMCVFFYTTSMVFFLLAFRHQRNVYLFLGIVLALLACGSRENAYYQVAVFLIVIMFNHNYKRNISFFWQNTIVGFIFILIILFFLGPCIQNINAEHQRAGFIFLSSRLRDYSLMLKDNFGIGWLLVLSLAIINGRSWNMFMLVSWVVIALIPMLFWYLASPNYLFNAFIGLSLIGGIGTYYILIEFKKYVIGKEFSNLRQILKVLVFMLTLFMLSGKFYNTFSKHLLPLYHYRKFTNTVVKNSVQEFINNTPNGEIVLVPKGGGEYYSYMAKFFDREDLKVVEINEVKLNDTLNKNL
jgi:hypothetical protein